MNQHQRGRENMKEKQKHWIDKDERQLPTYKLKKVSRYWTKNTWEEYGTSLESFQKEILFDKSEDCNNYSQEKAQPFYIGFSKRKRIPIFKKYMRSFIKELPENQQIVLIMFFWKGKNLIEIANSMNISRFSVLRLKEAALKSLSKKFINASMKIYQKKQSLPCLDVNKAQASKSRRHLKDQLRFACSYWTPKVWEKHLPYIEKDSHEKSHKIEAQKKNRPFNEAQKNTKRGKNGTEEKQNFFN